MLFLVISLIVMECVLGEGTPKPTYQGTEGMFAKSVSKDGSGIICSKPTWNYKKSKFENKVIPWNQWRDSVCNCEEPKRPCHNEINCGGCDDEICPDNCWVGIGKCIPCEKFNSTSEIFNPWDCIQPNVNSRCRRERKFKLGNETTLNRCDILNTRPPPHDILSNTEARLELMPFYDECGLDPIRLDLKMKKRR